MPLRLIVHNDGRIVRVGELHDEDWDVPGTLDTAGSGLPASL